MSPDSDPAERASETSAARASSVSHQRRKASREMQWDIEVVRRCIAVRRRNGLTGLPVKPEKLGKVL